MWNKVVNSTRNILGERNKENGGRVKLSKPDFNTLLTGKSMLAVEICEDFIFKKKKKKNWTSGLKEEENLWEYR